MRAFGNLLRKIQPREVLAALEEGPDATVRHKAEELHRRAVAVFDPIRRTVERGETTWDDLKKVQARKLENALHLWEEAATKGNAEAQQRLGDVHRKGEGVRQNFEEASKQYRRAAEQGKSDAMHKLSFCLGKVEGASSLHGEAQSWLKRAAEAGHDEAKIQYEARVGGAIKKWRRAAEAGQAQAAYSLGVAHEHGDHGPHCTKDLQMATEHYLEAAKKGHAAAQYRLGVLYSRGRGVPLDLDEAKRWLRSAAEQHHEKAREKLSGLI